MVMEERTVVAGVGSWRLKVGVVGWSGWWDDAGARSLELAFGMGEAWRKSSDSSGGERVGRGPEALKRTSDPVHFAPLLPAFSGACACAL
jgi:hypothetical protein